MVAALRGDVKLSHHNTYDCCQIQADEPDARTIWHVRAADAGTCGDVASGVRLGESQCFCVNIRRVAQTVASFAIAANVFGSTVSCDPLKRSKPPPKKKLRTDEPHEAIAITYEIDHASQTNRFDFVSLQASCIRIGHNTRQTPLYICRILDFSGWDPGEFAEISRGGLEGGAPTKRKAGVGGNRLQGKQIFTS